MKPTWHPRLTITVVALTLALTGCGSSAGSKSNGSSGSSGETKTLTIGGVMSLSGSLGGIAPGFTAGAKLAVEQMNAAGGLTVGGQKYMLKLDLKDDRSDPSVATSQASGLVNDQGVKLMIAESDVTAAAVANIALPRGVILLTPAASLASKLTPQSVSGADRTLFGTNVGPDDLAKAFAAALKSAYPNAKSLAIVFSQAPYGQQASTLWKKATDSLGLKADVESFPAGATDISTVLAKVKAKKPDVVIGGGLPADMNLVVQQSIQLGAAYNYLAYTGTLTTPLTLASGKPISQEFANVSIAGDIEKINGKIFTSRPGLQTYVNDLKSVLHAKVDSTYAYGLYYYDWLKMLGQAIEKAGTVDDTSKIASELASLKYTGGAIGDVSFSSTHTAVMPPDVCTVINGKIACKILSD